MNSQTRKPIRSGSRGRTDGCDDLPPLVKAIRSKFYRDPIPVSNGVPIYIHSPHGRKCAGYVTSEDGKRILRKTNVRESVHYCRVHSGYGIELDALKQAQKLGVQAVRLIFSDSDSVLEAPMSFFAERGHHDSLGGFGVQVFLKRFYWHDLSESQGESIRGGDAYER